MLDVIVNPVITNQRRVNALHDESSAVGTVIALTRSEAQALRRVQPPLSPWRVVVMQAAVGAVLVLLAWVVTGRSNAAWSVAYGALVVVIPAALFARGLMSRFSSASAVTAGFGFFVWEAVKIGLSVSLLAVAPKLVENLDWLSMLIGLMLTLQVYVVALLVRPKGQGS